MARAPKLIAFGGSIRQGSYSAKLLRILVQGARDAGAEVTEISLRDYPMPIYDGDLEASEGSTFVADVLDLRPAGPGAAPCRPVRRYETTAWPSGSG